MDWPCVPNTWLAGRFDAYAEAMMELAQEVTGTKTVAFEDSYVRGIDTATDGPL